MNISYIQYIHLRADVCKNQAAGESEHFKISRFSYMLVSFMNEKQKTFFEKSCFILDLVEVVLVGSHL